MDYIVFFTSVFVFSSLGTEKQQSYSAIEKHLKGEYSLPVTTLGARDFFLARFPVSVKSL